MASEREVTLAARLSQAEAAHGVYEREQLAGVFDEEWPRWYAEYLVAHGVSEVAPELADVERLTVMLAACDAAHRSEGSSEEWEPFYARRMLSGLLAGRLAVPASAGEHSVGPEHAPVTMVEYADFQCPDSAAAAPLLRGLRRRLEGRGLLLHGVVHGVECRPLLHRCPQRCQQRLRFVLAVVEHAPNEEGRRPRHPTAHPSFPVGTDSRRVHPGRELLPHPRHVQPHTRRVEIQVRIP